jgi:hypothetical protein
MSLIDQLHCSQIKEVKKAYSRERTYLKIKYLLIGELSGIILGAGIIKMMQIF